MRRIILLLLLILMMIFALLHDLQPGQAKTHEKITKPAVTLYMSHSHSF